jgi:predicted permease
VLQRGFELLFRPDKDIERRPDLYLALRLSYGAPRVGIYLRLIGRLRPGATLQRAQSQADAVAAQSRALEPAYRGAGLQFRLEPMQRYLVAQVRPAILALMGAVVFLLLIACSNVANLFLVRASARGRDLAVRTALGANWWRLARQMLAEALLVSAIGSLLGFGLAWVGVHDLLAIAPANLPRLDAARIDSTVLAFSMCAGLAAAVLFGLAPAMRAARPDVGQVLRASGRNSGLSGGSLLRNGVVVAEVALCFVLLAGSGLMFRSFLALQRIDPGFDPHGLMTFRTMGGKQGRLSDERGALVRQMQSALAAIPGVKSVTAANILPLSGSFFPYRWGKEDALNDFSRFQAADTQIVLPGYFDTMRTPLLEGRAFNEADNNPQIRHVIVDQALAAKAFPHGGAVGQRILSRMNTPTSRLVRDCRRGRAPAAHLAGRTRPRADVRYRRIFHRISKSSSGRYARKGDPAQYAAVIRREMAKFDRGMLLTDVRSMDSVVARAQTGMRFSLLLIAAFGAIAALLAGVGSLWRTLHRGPPAHRRNRRTDGARRGARGIFGLMIGYGLRLSAIGNRGRIRRGAGVNQGADQHAGRNEAH